MKLKTSELTGLALDYAVALASGATAFQSDDIRWFFTLHGDTYALSSGWGSMSYHPSTNWAQGGLLIEQEGISLRYLPITDDPFRWVATEKPSMKHPKPQGVYGPTPLIAAMRCFVASNLGDTVEVPYELV